MTFLVMDAQKNLFTLQLSQVQFEEQMVANQVTWCQKEMNYVIKQYSDDENLEDTDYTDDPYYAMLEQKETQLETEQSSLESQVTMLNSLISSAKNDINQNIKNECTLTLTGS